MYIYISATALAVKACLSPCIVCERLFLNNIKGPPKIQEKCAPSPFWGLFFECFLYPLPKGVQGQDKSILKAKIGPKIPPKASPEPPKIDVKMTSNLTSIFH